MTYDGGHFFRRYSLGGSGPGATGAPSTGKSGRGKPEPRAYGYAEADGFTSPVFFCSTHVYEHFPDNPDFDFFPGRGAADEALLATGAVAGATPLAGSVGTVGVTPKPSQKGSQKPSQKPSQRPSQRASRKASPKPSPHASPRLSPRASPRPSPRIGSAAAPAPSIQPMKLDLDGAAAPAGAAGALHASVPHGRPNVGVGPGARDLLNVPPVRHRARMLGCSVR